jgi:hypothetical protein
MSSNAQAGRRRPRSHPFLLTFALAALAAAGCRTSVDPAGDAAAGVKAAPAPAGGAETALVALLEAAYDGRDADRFAALLGDDFLFIAAFETGPETWDGVEERRIHRRMFEPGDVPPSEPPVPPDLWIAGIQTTLVQETKFTERPEFYRSAQNPDGLDPALWVVRAAVYATSVLVDTQGDTDFQIAGHASFVVQTSRSPLGATAPSLLRWQDLIDPLVTVRRADATAAQATSWSAFKQLYR